MKKWFFIVSLLISSPVYAAEEPGKALHDEHCLSCHVSLTNGEPERVYTREGLGESQVENYAQLQQRVTSCARNVGASWFAEETQQVTDYLNQTYYHFSKE